MAGDAREKILKAIEELDIDIVVLGSRGMGSLKK